MEPDEEGKPRTSLISDVLAAGDGGGDGGPICLAVALRSLVPIADQACLPTLLDRGIIVVSLREIESAAEEQAEPRSCTEELHVERLMLTRVISIERDREIVAE